jgi:hypothetical protein
MKILHIGQMIGGLNVYISNSLCEHIAFTLQEGRRVVA